MTLKPPHKFKLSLSEVTYILLSSESNADLARELKVSKQCISQIRLGKTYKHIAPDIRRKNSVRKACNTCIHWKHEECGLDVPESKEDPFYADECSYFDVST
jgi:hypothetical protein